MTSSALLVASLCAIGHPQVAIVNGSDIRLNSMAAMSPYAGALPSLPFETFLLVLRGDHYAMIRFRTPLPIPAPRGSIILVDSCRSVS